MSFFKQQNGTFSSCHSVPSLLRLFVSEKERGGGGGGSGGGCVGGRGELLAAVLSNNVTQSALSLSSQRDSLIRSRSTS